MASLFTSLRKSLSGDKSERQESTDSGSDSEPEPIVKDLEACDKME